MENQETDDQIKNSKPWLFKPGQSGNPAGRKKGSSFKDYIDKIGNKKVVEMLSSSLIPMKFREALEEFAAIDPNITVKEATAMTSYMNALMGDDKSRDFIADRSEGKSPETITIREDHVIIDIEDDAEDEE